MQGLGFSDTEVGKSNPSSSSSTSSPDIPLAFCPSYPVTWAVCQTGQRSPGGGLPGCHWSWVLVQQREPSGPAEECCVHRDTAESSSKGETPTEVQLTWYARIKVHTAKSELIIVWNNVLVLVMKTIFAWFLKWNKITQLWRLWSIITQLKCGSWDEVVLWTASI